ncbi:MAG: hypothetical protein IMZ44_13435 [Planctomycetes bacterium]|nr:hypothetical protein [Planctomycetota bacterium]
MSLRQDMLRAARRAKAALPDAGAAAAFVRGQALPDGGFRDRSGKADLYYSVFGLQCLLALDALDEPAATGRSEPAATDHSEPAAEAAGYSRTRTERYLGSFANPRALDLVHAACLARCWALVRPRHPAGRAGIGRALVERIEAFRSADGGYHPVAGSAAGSAYGCFLSLGAWQDLGLEPPDAAGIVRCVRALRVPGGGYTNEASLPFASAPATAAAALVLAEFGQPADESAAAYLANCVHPSGGLVAMIGAPAADLLSTATGLHALARMGVPPAPSAAAAALGFVADLMLEDGGFRGSQDDREADCEYTFYGLLALGHLAGGH